MRLLLDENLAKRLKKDLNEHEVSTVRDNGWNGKQNGELLSLLIENNFGALITLIKICLTSKIFPSILLLFLFCMLPIILMKH